MPAFRRVKQKNHKPEASLGPMARPCLKKKKKKERKENKQKQTKKIKKTEKRKERNKKKNITLY
jgi:hypothetical protein